MAISKGIKTAYQLQKAANIPPAMAAKWFSEKGMKMIAVDSLDLLCHVLNCQPSDLLEYVPTPKTTL